LQTERELQSEGSKTLAFRTDVAKAGDVKELARKTPDAFGNLADIWPYERGLLQVENELSCGIIKPGFGS
jgi:hypothetical protein